MRRSVYLSTRDISNQCSIVVQPHKHRVKSGSLNKNPRAKHGSTGYGARSLLLSTCGGGPYPRCALLPPQHLSFDGPGGATRLPGPVLMHLHRDPHRREKPPIILLAPHPTPLQLEDVFDQALHRLDRIAPLLV